MRGLLVSSVGLVCAMNILILVLIWTLGTFGVAGLIPFAWCAWSRRLGRRHV
jgi:hypothetical protein